VLDRKWREHLYEMDYLRAGIHLRAMAQRDPVVEYQREGFDMFTAMLDGIKEESVGFLFNLEVKTQEQQEAEALAAQQAAEAEALARAQEGTARVLARQAAEQAAAARSGNGHSSADGHDHGAGTATADVPAPATPSARRSGKKGKGAAAHAASAPASVPAAEPAVEPAHSGTGPELGVKGLEPPRRSGELTYSAPGLDASAKDGGPAKAAKTATVTGTKEPSRNAPCPCGSGKKYKVCHGRPGQSL
jgi:preprotein translocase subunit SecA